VLPRQSYGGEFANFIDRPGIMFIRVQLIYHSTSLRRSLQNNTFYVHEQHVLWNNQWIKIALYLNID